MTATERNIPELKALRNESTLSLLRHDLTKIGTSPNTIPSRKKDTAARSFKVKNFIYINDKDQLFVEVR